MIKSSISIELIAPELCPVCGQKMLIDEMLIDDRRFSQCPVGNNHSDRKCIIVYNHNRCPIGVNMYLGKWQFSFQEHILYILNNEYPFEGGYRFDPMPVELDFDKLQHKLQTILTFG